MKIVRLLPAVVAASCLLAPTAARADGGAVPWSSAPLIPVWVRGAGPGATTEVQLPENDPVDPGRVVLSCDDDCGTELPVGRYHIVVHRPDGTVEGTFRIKAPTVFQPLHPDQTRASVGLTLGILGSALAAVGVIALDLAFLGQLLCEGHQCDQNGGLAIAGASAAAAGGVLTPVGFVMFARNRSTFEQTQAEYGAIPTVRFGLAPNPSGLAGNLTLTF